MLIRYGRINGSLLWKNVRFYKLIKTLQDFNIFCISVLDPVPVPGSHYINTYSQVHDIRQAPSQLLIYIL